MELPDQKATEHKPEAGFAPLSEQHRCPLGDKRIRRQGFRALPIVLLVTTLLGCSTNAYLERSQFLSLSQDVELGDAQYRKFLTTKVIATDPVEVEPVRRVAARMIEAAAGSVYADVARQFRWDVTVVKDEGINAFVWPGGKIVVSTGFFPVCKNEAGLAVILGHEMTHALARHTAVRMTQAMMVQLGLDAPAASSQQTESSAKEGAERSEPGGEDIGLAPFSRIQEIEADHLGLLLTAQAGYDPHEAIRVWQQLAQLSQSGRAAFLARHPSDPKRIRQLEDSMAEAVAYYRPHSSPEPVTAVAVVKPDVGKHSNHPLGREASRGPRSSGQKLRAPLEYEQDQYRRALREIDTQLLSLDERQLEFPTEVLEGIREQLLRERLNVRTKHEEAIKAAASGTLTAEELAFVMPAGPTGLTNGHYAAVPAMYPTSSQRLSSGSPFKPATQKINTVMMGGSSSSGVPAAGGWSSDGTLTMDEMAFVMPAKKVALAEQRRHAVSGKPKSQAPKVSSNRAKRFRDGQSDRTVAP